MRPHSRAKTIFHYVVLACVGGFILLLTYGRAAPTQGEINQALVQRLQEAERGDLVRLENGEIWMVADHSSRLRRSSLQIDWEPTSPESLVSQGVIQIIQRRQEWDSWQRVIHKWIPLPHPFEEK